MGAWGSGPFDNDDAADWAADLEEADDPLRYVAEALATVERSSDHVEMPDATTAVAAAAWLASALPGTPVEPSEYVPDVAAPTDRAVIGPLGDQAAAVLDRVMGENSEWRELWTEAGDDTAAASVATLAHFLRGSEGPPSASS